MIAGFKSLLLIFTLLLPALSYAECVDTTSLMRRGHSLRLQGQYLLSSQQYSLVSVLSCSTEEKATAGYYYAASLYQLDEKEAAETVLLDLKKEKLTSKLEKKIRLLESWYEPNFRGNLLADEKAAFADFEKAKQEIVENERLKKPWVAGTLSAVLPGLGQVYNGAYSSAATSFILNALFLAATLEFHNKDLPAASIASGVIFSITYTGNIFGSIEASRQINRAYQAPKIEEMRLTKIPELEL